MQVSDVHKEGCKLKWKRPKDDGGTPIEYYQVEKMDPETGCWVPCGRSTEPGNYKAVISLVSGFSCKWGSTDITKIGKRLSVNSKEVNTSCYSY